MSIFNKLKQYDSATYIPSDMVKQYSPTTYIGMGEPSFLNDVDYPLGSQYCDIENKAMYIYSRNEWNKIYQKDITTNAIVCITDDDIETNTLKYDGDYYGSNKPSMINHYFNCKRCGAPGQKNVCSYCGAADD